MLRRLFCAFKSRGIQLMPEQRRQANRLALVMGNAGRVSAIAAGCDNAEAVKFALALGRGSRRNAGGAAQRTQTIQRPPAGLVGSRLGAIGAGVDLHAMHRSGRVRTGLFPVRDRQAVPGESPWRGPPAPVGLAAGECAPDPGTYYKLPEMLVKVEDRLVPTALTPPMITTAMSAAIRPYSMAVAPDSALQKLRKILRMRGPLKKSLPRYRPRLCQVVTAIIKKRIF